jgi:hypothetical protein
MQLRTHVLALVGLVTAVAAPPALQAQTDFYNLDKDRPLRVEDAFATKRWAFEIKASPLTLARDREGEVRYAPSLELTHGLLPGVSVSGGIHVTRLAGDRHTEAELSSLANLWIEGPRLPAAALRLTGHVPMEGGGSGRLEARGILTRTLAGPVRSHLNAGLFMGDGRHEDWWTGVALDWVLPFHHTLLLTDTWLAEGRDGVREIRSGAGFRLQLTPTLVLDAGASRSWTDDRGDDWRLTVGLAHEFGVRALMTGGAR